MSSPARGLVLGEDWVRPQGALDTELRAHRARRGLFSLYRSPLARKIILFNLLALLVLIAGILFINPFREGLVQERERSLIVQAELIADFIGTIERSGTSLSPSGDEPDSLAEPAGPDPSVVAALRAISLEPDLELFYFASDGALIETTRGELHRISTPLAAPGTRERRTIISDALANFWNALARLFASPQPAGSTESSLELAERLLGPALTGRTQVLSGRDAEGSLHFLVAAPVFESDGRVSGAVALASAGGEIDMMVRFEHEQVLQMFVVVLLVSVGLSLVLASTIANPLADLAAAAELGRDRNSRKVSPARVRIPDLAARPDEIGRLSVAMRGMVNALYDRIDANEQFAADVAHEIKNPLASLRSAVGTMRGARTEEQREKLLDVIEHDVRRLDRLVSDTSNASRLDSELVREQEETFDLAKMLDILGQHLSQEAAEKGVEFISELPDEPIMIQGLEARLAQVFVNLISNAISFCEDGDAVRIWARRRENRVIVVVEDTGPGIPEQALSRIFKRFYSERPARQFGNHSGLGLAISKQIVDAHGGVIWAENIKPTEADAGSAPLGARFVVGLPV